MQRRFARIGGGVDPPQKEKQIMENNEMSYEVRFLLNGEEQTRSIDAVSAAAAQELVRMQESGDEDSFELIQVLMIEDTPEEPQSV